MRVVFFGSPDAAIPSLERLLSDGHRVDLVVTQPDRPAGRGKALTPSPVKRFAERHRLPVLEPVKLRQEAESLRRIEDVRADIHIIVAYGQMLPAPLIFLPPRHSLNVHFSLLPKYRGAAPVAWCLLRGETKTGVTIIEINEKMDEGDILAAAETGILPGENAGELEHRLAEMGASLLSQTLSALDRIEHRPQDHAQASYAPKLRKEDGRLDWRLDAEDIARRIRAFTPRPSAFSFFRGRRVIFLRGDAVVGEEGPRSPGTILGASRAGLVVACGRGAYLAETVQPENKRPMSGYEFSLGVRLKAGDRFESQNYSSKI